MWGLLCSMSSIDQERKNISLNNVITQFNVPEADFLRMESGGHKGLMIQIQHELVVMFRNVVPITVAIDFKTDIKISLIDPKGDILGEILNTVIFPKSSKNLGHRINLNACTVTREGDYEYMVSIFNEENQDFEQLYVVPFTVEKIKKG